MSTFKKLIDLIPKRRNPFTPDGFWEGFDAGLRRRLDEIDAGRGKRLSVFSSVFFQPQFERALVTTALAVIIASFVLTAGFKSRPGLYPVASLTNDELVGELVLMSAAPASENIIDF